MLAVSGLQVLCAVGAVFFGRLTPGVRALDGDHRLQYISTVAGGDQIIVIDDGRVVGIGSHESLLNGCPTHIEFADSQAVGAAGPR